MLPLWLVLAGLLLAAGPASSHRGEMEPGTGGTGGGAEGGSVTGFSRSRFSQPSRVGSPAAGCAGAVRLARGGAVVRTRC